MAKHEILVDGPEWMQNMAEATERAANTNNLRCVFRTITTSEGPVVTILLAPAKALDRVGEQRGY